MKLETFFEKFDQFADAPDAVAKMRELVLQLAVQGKLAPQDPNDEPASVLLERVRGARRRLADKGRLKTKVHIPEVEADDQLYAIPKTWLWVPLNELTELVYGKLLPTSDLLPTGFPVFGANGIIGCFSKYLYEDEMLLISCRGAYSGTPNISPPKCYVTNNSIVCEFFEPKACDIRFYDAVISVSPRERIVTGSAQPQVTVANAIKLPVPLPPLAEQKRIVAKVDELMALCDRLEAQQQERETRHAALARASLARFADAPTPANLPFLFHPSYAIPPADLRKSILTLAVQGKLVPQDPNDEPAEEILRRSKVDLKRWAVAPDEERQAAPDSWTWIRFAGVGEQRLGKMLDAQKNRGELKPYLRNTNVQWMRFELDDVKDMRVEEREVEELRLKAGDLLICEGGEPGRCAIWRDEVGEMYFQKAIHRVRPCDAVTSEFLALNLQIDCANGVLAGFFTGATIKHLTGRSLAAYPVPIPPLAEQRRIVAKVEQLMALVDALETQLAASRATAANLLSALVAELTA